MSLDIGLVFFYAILFAASSLVIIYRPWLKPTHSEQEQTVPVAADRAQTPRELALELMLNQGLKGDLRDIKQDGDTVRFVIARPGMRSEVKYSAATSEAKVRTRREGFLEPWCSSCQPWVRHEFMPRSLSLLVARVDRALPLGRHGDLSVVLPPRRARDWPCDPGRGTVYSLDTGAVTDCLTLVGTRLSQICSIENYKDSGGTHAQQEFSQGSEMLIEPCFANTLWARLACGAASVKKDYCHRRFLEFRPNGLMLLFPGYRILFEFTYRKPGAE
jgi:hypothetical protein